MFDIKEKAKNYTLHYIPLLILFFLGVVCFKALSFDRYFQAVVAISVSFSYFAWGIVHHKVHNDLYLEIAMEYFFFSMLGLALILSLIFRA